MQASSGVLSPHATPRAVKPDPKSPAPGKQTPALRLDVHSIKISELQGRLNDHLARERPALATILRSSTLPYIHHISQTDLPRRLKNARRKMPLEAVRAADTILERATGLIDSASSVISDDSSDGDADLAYLMECMDAAVAEHPGDAPDAQQQRRFALIDFLGAVFRNEFTSDAGRWAANVINVELRTGIFVAICTLMRHAIDFELSKLNELGGHEAMLKILGIAAIAIAPAMNLIGGLVSVMRGTANHTSILCRLAFGILNLGVLLACYEAGKLDSLGRALPRVIANNYARDLCNWMLPLQDNLRSLPALGVVASGTIFGFFQWLGGMVMDVGAPRSGARGLPRAAGNETMPPELIAAAQWNFSDSAAHSLVNSNLEVKDDLVLPSCLKFFENRKYLLKEARNIQDETVHAQYMNELGEFARNLLLVPPDRRQQLIDKFNLDLYQRELKRMQRQDRKKLDDAHKQYLDNVLKELQLYEKTGRLQGLLRRTDISGAEIEQIRALERDLGIYRKIIELRRMNVNEDKLDDNQLRYLKNLRLDVKRDQRLLKQLEREILKGYKERIRLAEAGEVNGISKELSSFNARALSNSHESDDGPEESDDGPEESDEFKELNEPDTVAPLNTIENLRHELNDQIDLWPARLRPMSSLGTKIQDTRDFTSFDRVIDRKLRRHPELRGDEKTRQQIVQEEFVYEFQRLYLPLPILTRIEEDSLASIRKEEPDILPSQLTQKWVERIAQKRADDTEGVRIRLTFLPASVPSWRDVIQRLERSILVTDTARQNLWFILMALLICLDGLLEDSDETTRMVLGNLMAGMIIQALYPLLILNHSEGASPEQPVERPGAQGLSSIVENPRKMAELTTPRGAGPQTRRDDRNYSEGAAQSRQADEYIELQQNGTPPDLKQDGTPRDLEQGGRTPSLLNE
ncbi:hypothetical protein [Variovorax guangxiensis]|uniref:hypothetical protein n=1 Tax=Variovorax guangxiensis TaxID=1775474 RepID=UPI0028642A62|nr:hypothetical protein [Variovorax guangxiensis]MDR6860054.1 hypothetical protein [Variovorax guangxiensis]